MGINRYQSGMLLAVVCGLTNFLALLAEGTTKYVLSLSGLGLVAILLLYLAVVVFLDAAARRKSHQG
jgi:hypothetical protein